MEMARTKKRNVFLISKKLISLAKKHMKIIKQK